MQLPSKPLASTAVIGMGLLWAAIAGAVLLSTEFLENNATKYGYLLHHALPVLWLPYNVP